jgi:hypothetical protein
MLQRIIADALWRLVFALFTLHCNTAGARIALLQTELPLFFHYTLSGALLP